MPVDLPLSSVPSELIAILTREVPEERRNDPKCLEACLAVLRQLATPELIEGVCFHETGHFIHAVSLGVKAGFGPDEITMHGPRVIHHANPNAMQEEFEPSPGMISTPFKQMGIPRTAKILELLANIAVAGGVFAGKFRNQPTRGTSGDRDAFEDYYREALKTTLKNEKNLPECSQFLKDATTTVSKELDESQELQSLAKQIAEDYKLRFFQPFLDYCNLNSGSAQEPPEIREA
jgi:hypothetical protein